MRKPFCSSPIWTAVNPNLVSSTIKFLLVFSPFLVNFSVCIVVLKKNASSEATLAHPPSSFNISGSYKSRSVSVSDGDVGRIKDSQDEIEIEEVEESGTGIDSSLTGRRKRKSQKSTDEKRVVGVKTIDPNSFTVLNYNRSQTDTTNTNITTQPFSSQIQTQTQTQSQAQSQSQSQSESQHLNTKKIEKPPGSLSEENANPVDNDNNYYYEYFAKIEEPPEIKYHIYTEKPRELFSLVGKKGRNLIKKVPLIPSIKFEDLVTGEFLRNWRLL